MHSNWIGVIAVIGATVLLVQVQAGAWHYPRPAPNGVVNETERWGGQCDNGTRQSPIDLTFEAAVKGHLPTLLFSNYMNPIRNARVTNNGHSVHIGNTDDSVFIYGGALPGKYILDHLHFHWGSEHTINDIRYALEIHMVHYNSKYKSVAEAAAAKHGIAVLGILFHVSSEHNVHLDVLLDTTRDIRQTVGKSVPLKGKISPHNLLPKNRTSYFRYEGSLTTPNCAESVVWTVFTESLPVSLEQAEMFKTMHDPTGKELLINYRSEQPLNARALVYTSDWEYLESGAVAAGRGGSFLAGLVAASIFVAIVVARKAAP